MATDVETRLTMIENTLNKIQQALNNVPTKLQLNSLTNIRQGEVQDIDDRVTAVEGEVSSIPATISAEVAAAVPAEVATEVAIAVPAEVSKFVPITVSKTLFVDIATGDDANTGLEGAPLKTIQKAIDLAAGLQTSNPDSAIKIIIVPGIYNETIDVGNSALYALHFESSAGVKDKGPYITSLISTTGLENLKQLIFDGISFTNEVTLASDVDGTGNKFGDEGVYFRHCEMDEFPGLTIKNCVEVFFVHCNVAKVVLFENVIGIWIGAGSYFPGGGDAKMPIIFDSGLPDPGFGTTSYVHIQGGAHLATSPQLSPPTIGSGLVSLNMEGGLISCGYAITIGDGCRIIADSGNIRASQYGTLGVGSRIYLRGATIANIRKWTFDPASVVYVYADPYLARDGEIYVATDGNDVFRGSKLLPFKTVQKAIEAAAAYQQGDAAKPVLIYVEPGDYQGQSFVLEDTNLVDLHFKSEAKGDDPTYFEGLQSTVNNQQLESVIFEGIHFHAPINLSCPVDGATNRFGHDGFYFYHCEFQSTIYVQSLGWWVTRDVEYWGNSDFVNCFGVYLLDGSGLKSGGQYFNMIRDGNLPLGDLITQGDIQRLVISTQDAAISTLTLKTINSTPKTINLDVKGIMDIGSSIIIESGSNANVWAQGYVYSPSVTNNGTINCWGGQFWNAENAAGTGIVTYWSESQHLVFTGPEFQITPEGGYGVWLTSNTGAPTIAGQVVELDPFIPSAFTIAGVNSGFACGVVYKGGVADGERCLVITHGKAKVLVEDNSIVFSNNWLRMSPAIAGRAQVLASEQNDPARNIGLTLEAKSQGTDVLVLALLK